MAFAGFAALLAPAAPPPFVGLGADRKPATTARGHVRFLSWTLAQTLTL